MEDQSQQEQTSFFGIAFEINWFKGISIKMPMNKYVAYCIGSSLVLYTISKAISDNAELIKLFLQ